MSRSVEVLDRIAQSDDAVFAFDANDLIILWNKACERMLGRPAYQVLGRHCYDVMCGRDVFGNRYCCRSCPVTDQARSHHEEPVQSFELDVPVPGGAMKRVAIKTFAIPSARASSATLVHVLREPDREPSALEHELAVAVSDRPVARFPPRSPEGEVARLTAREQEILRRMAQGLTTAKIADALFISPVTVRNHIAKILSKLDVHTKLAAVAFAYRHGLVPPETPELPTLSAQSARRAAPAGTRRGSKARKA